MKDCKVCKIKITDFDPAFEDGVTTVLWAEKATKREKWSALLKSTFQKTQKDATQEAAREALCRCRSEGKF